MQLIHPWDGPPCSEPGAQLSPAGGVGGWLSGGFGPCVPGRAPCRLEASGRVAEDDYFLLIIKLIEAKKYPPPQPQTFPLALATPQLWIGFVAIACTHTPPPPPKKKATEPSCCPCKRRPRLEPAQLQRRYCSSACALAARQPHTRPAMSG